MTHEEVIIWSWWITFIILTLCLRVCCRSPIIPARPSYSAELMSLSYSGSLPRLGKSKLKRRFPPHFPRSSFKSTMFRSSGTSGSAPDLTSEFRPGPGGGASPVTEVWTNPAHEPGSNRSVPLLVSYSLSLCLLLCQFHPVQSHRYFSLCSANFWTWILNFSFQLDNKMCPVFFPHNLVF